jgi:N-acetylglucosamine-6-phosphate deacetylase
MGHTDATYEQAAAGKNAGAVGATHTFNAMRGFHHREPGMAGFALLCDDLHAELIYDHKHVSREAAALLLRSKPANKVVAVSDGSKATGLPPGKVFSMWGQDVETWERTVVLKGTETLAGSAITLLDAFRNLAADFGIETAIRLCSLNPRAVLGIEESPRTFVELDLNFEIVNLRRLSP